MKVSIAVLGVYAALVLFNLVLIVNLERRVNKLSLDLVETRSHLKTAQEAIVSVWDLQNHTVRTVIALSEHHVLKGDFNAHDMPGLYTEIFSRLRKPSTQDILDK